MITSIKEFGAYKFQKVDLSPLAGEEEAGNDCAIGPSWTPLPLLAVNRYNHDTRYRPVLELVLPIVMYIVLLDSIFRFALPNDTDRRKSTGGGGCFWLWESGKMTMLQFRDFGQAI